MGRGDRVGEVAFDLHGHGSVGGEPAQCSRELLLMAGVQREQERHTARSADADARLPDRSYDAGEHSGSGPGTELLEAEGVLRVE